MENRISRLYLRDDEGDVLRSVGLSEATVEKIISIPGSDERGLIAVLSALSVHAVGLETTSDILQRNFTKEKELSETIEILSTVTEAWLAESPEKFTIEYNPEDEEGTEGSLDLVLHLIDAETSEQLKKITSILAYYGGILTDGSKSDQSETTNAMIVYLLKLRNAAEQASEFTDFARLVSTSTARSLVEDMVIRRTANNFDLTELDEVIAALAMSGMGLTAADANHVAEIFQRANKKTTNILLLTGLIYGESTEFVRELDLASVVNETWSNKAIHLAAKVSGNAFFKAQDELFTAKGEFEKFMQMLFAGLKSDISGTSLEYGFPESVFRDVTEKLWNHESGEVEKPKANLKKSTKPEVEKKPSALVTLRELAVKYGISAIEKYSEGEEHAQQEEVQCEEELVSYY